MVIYHLETILITVQLLYKEEIGLFKEKRSSKFMCSRGDIGFTDKMKCRFLKII